jgi:hypothetical protein
MSVRSTNLNSGVTLLKSNMAAHRDKAKAVALQYMEARQSWAVKQKYRTTANGIVTDISI